MFLLLQAEECTRKRHGTVVKTSRRLAGKRRNCWIKSLFLFSLHTIGILVALTLKLNHWCHICTILMMSLLPFWALNISVALLSTEGQRALGFHQKDLHLCSEEEWRSYGFRTTWECVTNDRISILDKYFFKISFNFCKKKKKRATTEELFFFLRGGGSEIHERTIWL